MNPTTRPTWLTFDCYGTLIQWDEGLLAYVRALLARKQLSDVDAGRFIAVYDKHEHRLEQTPPHRSFAEISALSLRHALEHFGVPFEPRDAAELAEHIAAMPPFPEVVPTLAWLKAQGFRLCIVSNTDDAIIARNVAQLGGHIDRVITAQQAQAYKPSAVLFDHAHREIGAAQPELVHICASPHLDHAAARDMGFRCVWVDRGVRKPLSDYRPDATVPNLAGVVDVFTRAGWAR
jgi:2-haloacid dehalogenase